MLKNYLKTTVRNLAANKFYTLINIIGLATGLATCLLILLYVLDEFSFDRYNVNADRIYRVNNDVKFGGNHFDLAVAPALLGPTMAKELPQVEQYTRLRWYGSFMVRNGNENINEGRVGYADSTLFDVFSLPVIEGNPKTALKLAHSLVITESIANKYYNSTDVVGKTMQINDTVNYTITAVIKDIPRQSHFSFDFFVPLIEDPRSSEDNWVSENWNTYIVLRKNVDVKQLESQLKPFMDLHVAPELKSLIHQDINEFEKSGAYIRASLTPLTDIHLHSNKVGELGPNGNAEFVYIFLVISLLILVIASVNFMNLSTARSSNRAKEVGIRKVLGSLRMNLVGQFLTESMLISFTALVVSLLMAWLLLPYFNQLAGKEVHASALFQLKMLASLVALIIIVGLLAGSYPAFFLSSFKPVEVLKGKLATGFKRSWLRNVLVIFQFSISIILIIATIVIFNQLNYIHHKDIGFNRSQVMILQRANALGKQIDAFKNELLRIGGVKNATISSFLPVNFNRSNDTYFTSPALDQRSAISMQHWLVDENYIPTLDIKFLQGRNFSQQYGTDSTAIIVNEAAARFLGTKDILDQKLYEIRDIQTKSLNTLHVIGVIKNFNFSSLRDVVTPLALLFGKSDGNISIRINNSDIPAVISKINATWKTMAPGQPFEYSFMDEDFNKLYDTEQRTGKLFISFAALAILIACLGLFGLVTYAAEQRTREIGIRKVLGAGIGNIVMMISRDFLKLVLVASFIAFPFSWWAMNKWLQDFAYRVSLGWQIFLIAGVLAFLIAFLTVSFQAVRAAITNPTVSLKAE
ncbi:MAG TPA: ABC transporter permease [Puia sp.]|nr:ABC transporter permease [Puia sp.]